MQAGCSESVDAGCCIGLRVFQIDAASGNERDVWVDCAQLGHERGHVLNGELVHLYAVDACFGKVREILAAERLRRARQTGLIGFVRELTKPAV